jgi:hypothetical protein
VIIRRGVYRGAGFHFGPAGKRADSLTVFRAAPGERVLLTRDDGTPPAFTLADYVRVEGLWIGGRWTKAENQPIFAVGGSPIGRGKQLIRCTVFGYTTGILVGSSEQLLIRGCRIVHCGRGRFDHGCYLSGGYTKGAMTQHVILDDNDFVAGEGYAIHGWHDPHSCIVTRNFVSGYYWGLVLSGSDHLVAHNVLWRGTGQPGAEPGWNAWLPAERVVFVNNVLNSAIPINGEPGKQSLLSHNVYLSAPPHQQDLRPLDLRVHNKAVTTWIERTDQAVARIDAAFAAPVERVYENQQIDGLFALLRQPLPGNSGLLAPGPDLGLLPAKNRAAPGRAVPGAPDFWAAFDKQKLRHYDNRGQVK